jgi:hypothetical protein
LGHWVALAALPEIKDVQLLAAGIQHPVEPSWSESWKRTPKLHAVTLLPVRRDVTTRALASRIHKTQWRCCLETAYCKPIGGCAARYQQLPTHKKAGCCILRSATPVRRLRLVFLPSISSKSLLTADPMAKQSLPSGPKAAIRRAVTSEASVPTRFFGVTSSVLHTSSKIRLIPSCILLL